MTEESKRRLVEAGIDVDDALARLMQNEGLLMRLLRAFLQDANFAQLQEALAKGDVSGAFTAAHTLKGFMKELCANGGSIFFSTHVLEVAEKLCTKIAIIKNGELIRCGALEEVRGDSSLEDLFLELTE